jgi:hypothetical protein
MTAPRTESYGSRPIKRRRTKKDVQALRDAAYRLLEDGYPMTVRQVFYQLSNRGLVAKTEGAYKATVIRLLGLMRREGQIPFGWIADSTRWMRKPRSYDSMEEALRGTVQCYRQDRWSNQDAYVEVWCEKEAMAGVLYEITEPWDVPLMVTRGYPSLSFLYEAAQSVLAKGKPAWVYYLGDHDPTGLDITRAVEEGLREFAPGADIGFERLAVTHEQIELWDLPTRPTKVKGNAHAKYWRGGDSVELDAIPVEQLRELLTLAVERHVDRQALAAMLAEEKEQRELGTRFASAMARNRRKGGGK